MSGRGRLIMPLKIAFDPELLGKFPGNFDVKLSSVIHSCLLRLVMLRHVKQFSTLLRGGKGIQSVYLLLLSFKVSLDIFFLINLLY